MRRLFALAALHAAAATETVMLPMSDGVQLSTLVDMPFGYNGTATVPTVVVRSPYGHVATELIAYLFTLAGCAAVRQDVRGTGQSQGHFGLWGDSAGDGAVTEAWITSSNYSNGVIFRAGASADGLSVLAQMSQPTASVQASWLIFAGSAGFEMIFPGSALRYNLAHNWLTNTVSAADFPDCWQQVLSNEMHGAWWNRLNGTMYYSNTNWPMVMWAGWYDIFLTGALIGWEGLQTRGGPNAIGKQRLFIDPLGHCQDGASYFPRNTILGRAALPVLLAFDLFTGVTTPAEGVKLVTFYVMGANNASAPGGYFTTMDAFPVPTLTPLYLTAGNKLTWTQPATAYSQSFVFDPSNPVPTLGGNNLFGSCGPVDVSSLEARADVLDFTSPVLTDALAITGEISLTLYVSSNATDTDFTARLTDVYPDGRSITIQDGIIRMRWRNGAESSTPQMMTPGQIYPVSIGLWNTSYVFAPGHRVRVDVSSSNYPRFSVNPNNGLPLVENGTAVTANNSIYYGAVYPSAFIMPIVNMTRDLPPFPVLDSLATLASRLHPLMTTHEEEMRARAVSSFPNLDIPDAAALRDRDAVTAWLQTQLLHMVEDLAQH